ncbi:MAG: DUF3048 domain-containing protein [Lachnospiraceae bacterium]|jgi:hypothetical protein|nr:DUF3048 domain-containing protein [Lachnospiraceae bacterium]NBJ81210.1 DUF3048 domain-containing protein [bacterium 1XD42-76]NBK04653.1 DUF3048 domain-containing protein [bacterium 1XD42-94]
MKKPMRPVLLLFLTAILLAGALCGCGKQSEPAAAATAGTVPETTKAERTKASVVLEMETERDEGEQEVPSGPRSYLTGEPVSEERARQRPVAVMMSNDKAALPQYGINRAGVVYEAPVEGGMNRFMALIEDYGELERIGSVRSCRTYYTYFAREFDAVYVHFGQSTFAVPYLKNVDNINGIDGTGSAVFFRSKDRKSPHNAYIGSAGIKSAMERLGYRTEYEGTYQGHYQFTDPVDGQVMLADCEDAYKIIPGYPVNAPWFEYQEQEGVYHRFQYGDHHKGNESLIAVKNVIFQYVEYGHYATTEYLNINVHTGHEGFYFTNGKCQKITWKKDGEFGPTRYYGPDGREITLNTGKTWICIIGADQYDKAEIYGK